MSVIDLLAGQGRGPLWGDATEDLNLPLLAWPAGERPAEHVNDERDVVIVVTEGAGLPSSTACPTTSAQATSSSFLEA